MNNNQNILKKKVANGICRENIDTSIIMFPVRMETRLLNREITTLDEGDRIYFVFKSLWHFFDVLQYQPNQLDVHLSNTEKVRNKIQDMDVIYKEDYDWLMDVLTQIHSSMLMHNPEGELARQWQEIIQDLKLIKPMSSLVTSKTTQFVNQLEQAQRKAYHILYNTPYQGYDRDSYLRNYSHTASFKAVIKHLKRITKLINRLLTIQDVDTYPAFEDIPAMQYHQKVKLKNLLDFPLTDEPPACKHNWTRDEGLTKAFERAFKDYTDAVQDLDEQKEHLYRIIDAKPVKVYRYTMLLSKMCLFRMHIIDPRTSTNLCRSNYRRWMEIERHTMIDYVEEGRLLMQAVTFFNSYVNYKDLSLGNSFLDRSPKAQYRTVHFKELKKCLCVRIYPDVLAVTAILRPLSKVELQRATDFWCEWKKLKDEKQKKELWSSFCKVFAPNRAAWILRQVFKCMEEHPDNRKEALEKMTRDGAEGFNAAAAFTQLMPDRFVVQATCKTHTNGKRTLVKYGHRIPKKLQISFDFDRQISQVRVVGSQQKGEDHMVLNGNLRWMTDYDEAERMGMAVSIPINELELMRVPERNKKKYTHTKRTAYHFSSIYVSGVKGNTSTIESSQLIRKALESHLFGSNGLDVIPFLTPTNILFNEDEQQSDFNTKREHLEEMYFEMIDKQIPESFSNTDAYHLSKVFGIQPNAYDNPLRLIPHVEQNKIWIARLQNQLFMLRHGDPAQKDYFTFISRFKRSGFERLFLNHVLPCGVYAPLRIGDQPYGILPVTDFKNMQFEYGSRFNMLKDVLLFLSNIWNSIVERQVIYDGNNREHNTNQSDNFLRVLGNSPYSAVYYKRKMVTAPGLLNPLFFRGYQSWSKVLDQLFTIVRRHRVRMNLTDEDCLLFMGAFDIPMKDVMQRCDKVPDAQVLDLFLYRLDAWFVGILNRHIQRLGDKYKVKVGAYGWVFDAIFKDEEQEQSNNEYVLAPSVNHAITAAVLRSSFNRNNQTDGYKDYNLNVNLSSVRVRKALHIIKGIRNGLSLGAILGSHLEQLIHEDYKNGFEMDEFIYELRERYPLSADQLNDKPDILNLPKITVLNGLALIEKLRSLVTPDHRKRQLMELYKMERYTNSFRQALCLYPQNHTLGKFNRLMELIVEMEDAYDALADVIMSESVYKLTEGNRTAVDALMKCMEKERNIPLPDVVEIPLNSAHIEERVMLPLDYDPRRRCRSILSAAEPTLDHWLEDTLHLNQFRFSFAYGDKKIHLSADDLKLSATELVHLSDQVETFGIFLSYQCWQRENFEGNCPEFLPDEEVENAVNFAESQIAIDALRQLLISAHPFQPSDFNVREKNSTFAPEDIPYDLDELNVRYEDVKRNWRSRLVKGIEDSLKDTDTDSAHLRETLEVAAEAFRVGQSDALLAMHQLLKKQSKGIYADRFDQQELSVKFNRILKDQWTYLQTRLSEAKKCLEVDEPTCENYLRALGKLTAQIRIVPLITYTEKEENTVRLQKLIATLKDQLEGESFTNLQNTQIEMDGWLTDLARVRKPVQALHELRMYNEWNLWPMKVTPAQLVSATGEAGTEWIGMPVNDEKQVNDTKSYVMLNGAALQYNRRHPLCGLVLDFWVERIPYKEQNAAVAFHYDQPDAEAPQSILVGLCTSKLKGNWSENQLNRVIRSTMHMVKGRAVEPEHIYQDERTAGLFPLAGYTSKD